MINRERLRQLFEYDPESGIFTRKMVTARWTNVGDVAGYLGDRGYVIIGIDRKFYKAHRLAWLYVHGQLPKQVDHINGIRNDNRICNLRACNHAENQRNVLRQKNNTSGFKGVSWHKGHRKWSAGICINGKRRHLGYFESREECHLEYVKAALANYGDFTNDGDAPLCQGRKP